MAILHLCRLKRKIICFCGSIMKLALINHSFRYELEKLIRIFMPFEKIGFCDYAPKDGDCAVTVLDHQKEYTLLKAELYLSKKHFEAEKHLADDTPDYEKECERLLAVALYDCFVKASGYVPPWGILTGVRPAKLFLRLKETMGQSSAEEWFKNALLVHNNKISLCAESVAGEEKIISLSRPDSFSLYISVPFCPTRCSYCSFVSHSIAHAKALIPEYVNLLIKEIEITAAAAHRLGLRLETIYIGGGTPTTLSADQLSAVMEAVNNSFDLSYLREYTVEAGRPDTVTAEKLSALKCGGATRISINPQTMNDAVLEKIGRKHTAAETEAAFLLARRYGFDNINMDLIAGLPSDTLESFKSTVERVLALNPESITVHSLSMKRASGLTAEGVFPELKEGKTASEMVDYAHDTLSSNGILPYYMYRQSKTIGNLENVGYAKQGTECLYNVYIMDETHTILACGASAVTKLREPGGNYIERIFNFKYPYEYINRFNELMERKDGIFKFYEKYPAVYK